MAESKNLENTEKENAVTVFKYRLFDKDNREHCNLKVFKSEIIEAYKLHEPHVDVKVDSDSYTIISEEPKIKAVKIGKELSSYKKLAAYGGHTKGGKFRLFERCGKLTVKKSDSEDIYYYFVGGKQR